MKFRRRTVSLFVAALLFCSAPALAQLNDSLLSNFKWRDVGPAIMGGRIADLAVYEANPSIYYAATASGGLLKTVNGGMTWQVVFDRQDTVSLGDVTINPTDPNIVWVGTGEANNRQSSSWGDGVYKSTDGGRTWKNMGLGESHHVGRIVVNPTDTDIVYVAAGGRLWGPNRERGVFMTTDGGLNWTHSLYINDDTGVSDLAIDPANPKILYAAAYQRRRSGWGFNGGGPGSGIYKTVDGGRTWRKLSSGLPAGDTGRIGLDIYRKNPNVVYATVENRQGGIFRSDDKGETWTRVNALNPRPMYFSQIRIDPNDDKRILVGGVQLNMSEDGGRTFNTNAAIGVHSDHHALWINPANGNHLILGNDGGLWVSLDSAKTWDHVNNVAIGQFYNVAVDMQKPYKIYGGMQDNYTWGGPSSTRNQIGIVNDDWFVVNGGDGMYVQVDPADPNTVYTNSQNGAIIRYDLRTGERKSIRPEDAPGSPQLRWNWTTPILISPHDPKTLYTGANKLFKSTDRAQSWTAISPDLTTQTDRETLSLMGVAGKDISVAKNDGMASFGNITAIAESVKRAGLIYVGTDDGLVHVTRDGGKTWTNLTDRIQGVPGMLYVSRVWPSAFDEGAVYVSFDGHRSNDFNPYVFVSADFGQTWRSIRSNLPNGSVYVVKEDRKNQNLLYLGTEFGLFLSLDRGASWTRWKNLPTVAVYDLTVHPRDNDLILGTHGRSFQVVDDITPIQQLTENVLAGNSHLFDVRPSTQFSYNNSKGFLGARDYRAPNPQFGAYINYYLKSAAPSDVQITILDPAGKVVRQLKGPKEAGIHRVAWDLRLSVQPDSESRDAMGPFALPGDYRVRINVGGQEQVKSVRVEADPAVQIADADRRRLHDTLVTIAGMQVTAGSAAVAAGRLSAQIDQINELMKSHPNAPAAVKRAVEDATKQVRDARSKIGAAPGAGGGGGGFGAGGGLRGRITGLYGEISRSQYPATAMQVRRFDEATRELTALIPQINTLISVTMPNLYKQLNENNIHPSPGEPIKPVTRN